MSRLMFASLVALSLVWAPRSTHAAMLSAVDSGFVTMAGGSSKGDGTVAPGATFNYSVGYELHYATGALGMPPGSTPLAPMDRNNYFVFDLSAIGAPILSATLILPAGMLESVDGIEVFDIVAPVAPLAAIGDASTMLAAHAMGPAAFDSPMDPAVGVAGALYGNIEGGTALPIGSTAITSAADFSLISIPLTPLGVSYLNGFLGGIVILGGSVPSIVAVSGSPQQPFGFTAPAIPGTGPSVPVLEITVVPEASTTVLLALAMSVLLATRMVTAFIQDGAKTRNPIG